MRFDWCASSGSGGLSIYVEGTQGQARIALPDGSAEDDAGRRIHRPVTPRLVARIVRWAFAQGWSPGDPGLTVLRYADGWGVPEPEPRLDEREVITLGDAARLEVVVAPPVLREGADPKLAAAIERSELLRRPPYAKGALDLRLQELNEHERSLVIRSWYAEQRLMAAEAGRPTDDPQAVLETTVSLGGGFSLWDDSDQLRIMPQYCCTVASIASWREASAWREPDPSDLWTGHPWCVIRYRAPHLWIETNMRGRPLAIHPRHLRRLFATCEQALLALRVQAQEVLLGLGLPSALAQAYAEACAGYLGTDVVGEARP